MTENNDSGLFSDSRRSFMKKGALATTAVALGAGATGTVTAQDDGNQVVVFGDDYHPGVEFEVASQLDQGTKDEVFQAADLQDEFDTPDDWDVYLINTDMGGSAPSLGYLLTEDADLSSGDSETMGEDGSFRNAELNLVETSLGASGDGGGDSDSEEEDDAENETDTTDDGPTTDTGAGDDGNTSSDGPDDGPGGSDGPGSDDGPGAGN